jgi:hypothetical protein
MPLTGCINLFIEQLNEAMIYKIGQEKSFITQKSNESFSKEFFVTLLLALT